MVSVVVGMLAKNGLSLLAKVAKQKGGELIKEKTGVDVFKAELSPQEIEQLKRYEMEHEETLQELALEGEKVESEVEMHIQTQVTERHTADMKSDSWLSKNIRPLALVVLLLTCISALFTEVPESKYKDFLDLCKVGVEFYFGGRSLEKISGGALDRGKSLLKKIRGK